MQSSNNGLVVTAAGLLVACGLCLAGLAIFWPAISRSDVVSGGALVGVAFLAAVGALVTSLLSLGSRAGQYLAAVSGVVVMLFALWWMSGSDGPEDGNVPAARVDPARDE